MSRAFRLLRLSLVALGGLLLLATAAVGGLVWLTLPGGDLQSAIPGLAAAVDIRIDADGVPRIRAGSREDAAAALGFLHARERLFQMDLMRRAASGELSEIAGRATLALDRQMRTLGVRQRAEADLALLPPPVLRQLDAYARGVNAWIDARGRFSAEEFVPFGAPRLWTAVDSLLWGKTMGLYLAGNWRTELARLGLAARLPPTTIDALWPPGGGAGQPQADATGMSPLPEASRLARLLPAFPDPFTLPATASNEWAVDGAHSASGAPLLAGDPHLAFGLPGIWYLARIDTPEGALAGATAPGVPFLVLGHNGRIAWTFTTTGADVQDIFEETPAGDGQYLTPDGPRPFETRTERIRIRGEPDDVLTVRSTRHGPVISDLLAGGTRVLALAMANLQPGDDPAAGLFALNGAADVAAAGRAAAAITSPNQNLLVADRAGIGLFVTGRVPVRRAGDGSRPVAGADGAHDWVGWAEGDALPHVVAPPSGRLVNANERIAGGETGAFLARDWFGDERARRIRELLDATPGHTAADFARMQLDAQSVTVRGLLPRLRAVAPPDEASRAALATLAGWDATMAVDAPQPLLVNVWMARFYEAVLARAGVVPGMRAAAAPWPLLLPAMLAGPTSPLCGGDCGPLLAETLGQSVAAIAARFGADPARWRWGDAHQAVFAHPLLREAPLLGPLVEARIAAPGDDTTVDRGGMAGGSLDAIHGASFRAVYDLADLDASLFTLAPGQSGHAASRLARNMVLRWRDGAAMMLRPAPEQTQVTIRLVPESAPGRQ